MVNLHLRTIIFKGFIVLIAAVSLLYGPDKAFPQENDDKLTARQKEILTGIAKYAPWDCPDRWVYELGPPAKRNILLRKSMLKSESWIHFVAYASVLEWHPEQAKNNLKELLDSLPKLESGKIRQNIIFLIALTAPDAKKTLREIFDSKDKKITDEDRNDAGCALAMLGDDKAAEWFEKKFKGSDCMLGRPVFSFNDYLNEEQKGERHVTRSYRSWEVLFGKSYFRRLEFLCRSNIYGIAKNNRTREMTDKLARKFLPLFPAKWPGHPGCDDFAMKMLNYAIARKDRIGAYQWAQRASLLPDQDCQGLMIKVFTALAESQLSITEIDSILDTPDGKHNRDFLQYTRFLALARHDKRGALDYFDSLALADKHGFFAQARRLGADSPVPQGMRKGMDSNLTLKILVDFPKRSRKLGETLWEHREETTDDDYFGVLNYRERQVALRTRLARKDSVNLSAGGVANQYRIILELANLEKLEKAQADKSGKADLRYKQASIVYNNKNTFFPVWARHHLNFGYNLNQVRYDDKGDERLRAYAAKTFYLRRAYNLFASLQKDFPDYEGKDKVLFSIAKCYAKLMDYRPAKGVDVWTYPDQPPKGSREGKIEYGHRRVAELFRKVVNECPTSTLADDAKRAAEYREKMTRILRIKREKEEKQQQ